MGCNWAVLGCNELYWAVVGCSGLYWLLGCSGLYCTVLGCTRVAEVVSTYDLSRFTHFLEIFGQKSALLGPKQCFLGKNCTIIWYILHISLS